MKISWVLIILGSSQVLGLEILEPLILLGRDRIGPSFASRIDFNKGQLISKGDFGVFKSDKKTEMFVNILPIASNNWLN